MIRKLGILIRIYVDQEDLRGIGFSIVNIKENPLVINLQARSRS